ncbi:HAD-like domain-containing protein, partial [Mycena latifolia]
QIMYFDVYGTLIDNESGIFDALQPLLAQAPRRLQRREALTFYFESETEVKQCMPTAPYPQILARAHSDMATRLGLVATEEQSSLFASSIATWPLFNGALWCLQTLNPWIPILVALCDVDHESLRVTSAFTALAPYFAEVFTWDASHAYRPDRTAFDPPFRYHDALGVPREQRCLISNSVLRDLEPAHELDFPAIWMRYPESLAGTV